MLESWAFNINSSSSVIAKATNELVLNRVHILRHNSFVLPRNFHPHFNVVVSFHLNKCLLVQEVFEVAVDQVQSRRMCSITVDGIESVKVKKYIVPVDIWEVGTSVFSACCTIKQDKVGEVVVKRCFFEEILVMRLSWTASHPKWNLWKIIYASVIHFSRDFLYRGVKSRPAGIIEISFAPFLCWYPHPCF